MYLARNGNQKFLQKSDCNSPGKELLGRDSCRWNDNIRMHLIKTTREGIVWLQVAQNKCYWWDLTNMIIIVCLYKRGGVLDHLRKCNLTKGEEVTWSWVRSFPLIPFGSITNLIICIFHKAFCMHRISPCPVLCLELLSHMPARPLITHHKNDVHMLYSYF